VIVGLALLAASLDDIHPSSFWRAAGRGALWGTAAGIIGLRFVPAVIRRFTDLGTTASLLALVLLASGQSLTWAIGAGAANVLRRRAHLPFEIAFGAGVLVTLSLPAIFVWSPAGLVSPWPAFVQLADVVGERGVSVLLAIGAASLARAGVAFAARERRALARPALVALAIFVLLPLHGTLRIGSIVRASAGLPVLRVGLVDQAVTPHARWDVTRYPAILRTLRDLTRSSEAQGADLTVWPEAAYPYALGHEDRLAPSGRRAILGNGVRGPILFGLITQAPPVKLPSGDVERNSYNSATLVLPDGSLQAPYDKLQLLWFGETVPGGAYLPWLRRLFQRSGGLVPGDVPRALELPPPPSGGPGSAGSAGSAPKPPGVRMAVLNCYEDTLPDLGRRLATALSPRLLVDVTNDAWFHDSPESELHARLGAMRAIELRRDLVRAVNLGVTSWVDAAGVVRARYDAPEPGTLLVTPHLREPTLTFYARWGDAPAYALFALITAFCARRRVSFPTSTS
jgi:apolipoprotein N-acyltransferase